MGLISAFFRQTATITPFVRQGNGEPIYGEPEQRPCRMERGKHIKTVYKNMDGLFDDVVADAKMFCEGEAIPPDSKVECDGQQFTVINCRVMNGFADHHLEVMLM